MAGKKDKSDKRNELTIGLFEHSGKSFRAVLNKRKYDLTENQSVFCSRKLNQDIQKSFSLFSNLVGTSADSFDVAVWKKVMIKLFSDRI